MALSVHLDFDPYNADHRRAANWLSAQADPAEAVVQILRAVGEAERRLRQWEELAALLANDLRQVRSQIIAQPSPAQPMPEVHEDPESARRLDSMFK